MPRIQLLLLLKSFIVGVGHSQIGLPTVNASELPIQYLSPGQTHVFKESIPLICVRDDIIEKESVQPDHLHKLIFVVRHKNMDQIVAILNDISNASSQNYRHHLSKEQIDNLTSNKESRAAVVSYLLSVGASVSAGVQSWEYITATAPVGLWESFFQSTFYKYYQLQHDGSKKEFIRAHEYCLPTEMKDHIESIFNIIQFPHRLSSKVRGLTNTLCPFAKSFDSDMSSEERSSAQSNFEKISDFYETGSIKGNSLSSLGIFAMDHQCEGFDNLDSSHQISKYIFNNIEELSTVKGPNDLLTYLNYNMASSPGSPTLFHCTNAHFSDWLVMMATIDSLPLVISLAIDIPETYLSKAELDAFNILAIKLTCMGITIIAPSGYYFSTGDAGLGQGTENQLKNSFIPSFPASNTYVTAVAISVVRPINFLILNICRSDFHITYQVL